MPGPRRSGFAPQLFAAAAAAATTAAVGTLVTEVPRVILRVAWVGLRGQNGGEGEKCGESNKGERFHT